MQIELTESQMQSIVDQAKATVEKEALSLLRAAVNRDLPQWVKEVKNAARGAVADAVTVEVMKRLDVSASVDKAMDNINKRIHTELTRRLSNGINVTFAATVANPAEASE
jgi:ribosomal protein S7